MQLRDFPMCCTANILTYLGPSGTAGGGGWEHGKDGACNEENFFRAARELMEMAGRRGLATIIAITNSDQRVAMETLPKLGFVLVQEKIGKNNHADKTLNTYVYTICDEDRRPKPLAANPFAPAAREEAAIEGNPFHPANRRAQPAAGVGPRAGEAVRRDAAPAAEAAARDFNAPPVPRGRNRELEATPFYQAVKAKLVGNPDAYGLSWEVIRRNIRIAYEESPRAWDAVGHMMGGRSDCLRWAFIWRETPQGHEFWARLRNAGL